MSSRRFQVPVATYRLQLRPGFGFQEAEGVLPYLERLGVSHVYLSPIFAAVPGSTHGYDVVDHGSVNPELGGLAGFYRFAQALRDRGMGLILDIVPNHVGVRGRNPWWWDVLQFGPRSPYADYFDIEWSGRPELPAGVLVYPVLGRPFGIALEAGEIRLALDDGEPVVTYYDHVFPLAPETLRDAIGLPPLEVERELRDPAALPAFAEALEAMRSADVEAARLALERFRRLIQDEPALRAYVESRLLALNGSVGDPRSFDPLDDLLGRQHYRLAYWRVSAEEINYRRFFDINDLAAIRVEHPPVFEAVHRLLLEFVRGGLVSGVRVDHVDGLYDPTRYLERLHTALQSAAAEAGVGPVRIYVEKILALDEQLPEPWPVEGTTGYDFLAHADGLFVDRAQAREATAVYEEFVGARLGYGELAFRARLQVAREAFAGEISVLALMLHRLAKRERRYRDTTLGSLREAIEAVLAAMPVYRTYMPDDEPAARDRELISRALAEAARRRPALTPEALEFLREVLLLERRRELDAEELAQRVHFRRKFQQLSSPMMAKGIEDTTFFRYNRLLSLNEVGNEPERFGVSADEAHAFFAERAARYPRAMSATSTHDTKRSESVRARLHLLSSIPRIWRREVRAWSRMNAPGRSTLHGEPVPEPNVEYYLFQTLVGAWEGLPVTRAFRERMHEHLTKALREMKEATAWSRIDDRYEAACHAYLERALSRTNRAFLRRLDAFVRSIAPAAAAIELGLTALKLTAPGVPDIYQGTELPRLMLTDPDNRRPVAFESYAEALAEVESWPSPPAPTHQLAKLWLTRTLLHLRSTSAALSEGTYSRLDPRGEDAHRFFAFVREARGERVLVCICRLPWGLVDAEGRPSGEALERTILPLPSAAGWRDMLSPARMCAGGEVPASDLLNRFPVAVLREES